MAKWDILKTAIADVIKSNDNQEITGQILQNSLNRIISAVGENATFAGLAYPNTNPGLPDGPIFYLASTPGDYPNFTGIILEKNETALLNWNAESKKWEKKEAGFVNQTAFEALEADVVSITPKKIIWSYSANLAQWTFRFPGIYDITGERTNKNDGFPIDNASPGHTINARLIVLDSSLPQASDTPQEDDACITQILMLSNRMGGEGSIYIRSARGHIDRLLWPADGSNFTPWIKLQGNMEVGATYSLDSYIDNGIVSGVHVKSAEDLETFVLIVINNYPAVGAVGNIVSRSVSQFKYAVDLAGNVTYKSRVKIGDSAWSSWAALATDSDIKNVKDEITKRIQGTSENSSALLDPFKYFGKYSTLNAFEEAISLLASFGGSPNGIWRATVDAKVIEIAMLPLLLSEPSAWIQTIKGCYTIKNGALHLSANYHTLYRNWNFDSSNAWSEWRSLDSDIKNAKDELLVNDYSDLVFSLPFENSFNKNVVEPDEIEEHYLIASNGNKEPHANLNYSIKKYTVKKGDTFIISLGGDYISNIFCLITLRDNSSNTYFKLYGHNISGSSTSSNPPYTKDDNRKFIRVKHDGELWLSNYDDGNPNELYRYVGEKYFCDEVLWLGTSIPTEGEYPERAAQRLGFTVYNNSISSSGIVKLEGHLHNGRDALDLSETKAEKLVRYADYDGSLGGYSKDVINWFINVKGTSYEDILLPYIDGTKANCKMIVWDHGYNDGKYITDQVKEGYENIEWESTDRSTYTGAFRYLLEKIYAVNPEIIVVIAGYFSDNHKESTYNTKDVCIMQEWIAKKYNLPLIPMWDLLHISDDIIVGTENKSLPNSNTTVETFPNGFSSHRQFCLDKVHPSIKLRDSEPNSAWKHNERSISLYTEAIIKGLKNFPGYTSIH